MDVDRIADELYSLPPGEFTVTRNAYHRQLRSGDGADPDAAAAVKKLTKPTTAAWLANQLARQRRSELAPLLELGEDTRAAAADGDGPRLRELFALQRTMIAALVDEAREVAGQIGININAAAERDLIDTLKAAVSDAAAAAELATGRLAAPLYRSGFDSGIAVPAGTAGRGRRPSASGKGSSARRHQRPEAGERERERERERRRAVDRAQQLLDAAQQAADEAADDVTRLRAELQQAQRNLAAAERARDRAAQQLDAARDEHGPGGDR